MEDPMERALRRLERLNWFLMLATVVLVILVGLLAAVDIFP
jgi:hypothetical protein